MMTYCEVVENLAVMVVAGAGVKEAAERVQEVPGAVVVQVAVTGAEKPAIAVVRRVAVVALPAMTVPEVGVSTRVKSTPLPVRAPLVVE